MNNIDENKEKEERIENEVIIDAYGSYEKVTGWYCYLNDKITFPFSAVCIKELKNSPLKEEEHVSVLETSEDEDNLSGLHVIVEYNGRKFEVPLAQLKPLNVDRNTKKAIEDWHYWVNRGYLF